MSAANAAEDSAGEATAAAEQAKNDNQSAETAATAAKNSAEAAETAQKAVEEDGCVAIELCGGFGYEGAAMVARAVKVPVGVVRFDIHPGLGNVSGDGIFA